MSTSHEPEQEPEHEPDCHGNVDSNGACEDFCWSCCKCEPMREGDFIVCFECGHVYRTADDLVKAWVEAAPDEAKFPAPKAENIHFCQVCLHDF